MSIRVQFINFSVTSVSQRFQHMNEAVCIAISNMAGQRTCTCHRPKLHRLLMQQTNDKEWDLIFLKLGFRIIFELRP